MQKGFSPGKNRLQQTKKFKMFYVTPNQATEKLMKLLIKITCKLEFRLRHHLLHHQYQVCLVELKIYLVLADVEKHQKKCIKRDQNRVLKNQIRTLKNQDQNHALINNL